jgi:hypothetical protein
MEPKILKMDLEEVRAVERVADPLPYGKFNADYKAMEALARAAHRAKKTGNAESAARALKAKMRELLRKHPDDKRLAAAWKPVLAEA